MISATGTHRCQTKEEHMGLVTEEIYNRIKLVDHQCTDEENLKYMGTTTRNTPVWLDSRAIACDRLILTGGVVYHFLAGYGGGRKSIVPGIAGRETIMKNHNLALNPGFGSGSNPNVRSAVMDERNPFHMDLMEAAAMAHPDFLLNVVVDDEQKIIGAFAGNYIEAHKEACKLVDSIYGVYVKEKTPLVIASAGGYPKDLNLYQTSKTICNALEVVSEGGTIILISKCSEAFGDADCERLINGYPDMLEREKSLRENFSIGAYIGYLFAESAEKYNLIIVTDLSQESFGTARIHAVKSLDEAMDKAKELNGADWEPKTTLLPHGANTLPKFE
ncbi:MAG: nickel-dependent lactate racemase [Lachnospiraceae bacterium]|nr:nickel-dependent lactate racemase [Lachnospiraceae bacterium]MDD3616216.1 nickel-dependent lactate racemase [Lachnospiraceae bacterium]